MKNAKNNIKYKLGARKLWNGGSNCVATNKQFGKQYFYKYIEANYLQRSVQNA